MLKYVMVKFGDKGASVAEVQKMLSLLGYDLIMDASFGNRTLRSVKAFQKKYGLEQDGIVGEKTMIALKAAQKKTAIEGVDTPEPVDYDDLDIQTECQMPDNQYIKRITPKSQIFLHFTAGHPSAKSTIDYWDGNETQVATAYVIDGDNGLAYQAFHPDFWAFHLGIKGANGRLDKASIGIEICGFGPLAKKGDSFYAWPNDYTTKVSADNVYELEAPFRGYKHYFKFTDSQIETLESLLVFLIKKYNIKVQTELFDAKWLEFNQNVISNCLPGIWSHSNVRKDKFDIYPDHRILEMLNRISKQFN